MLDAAGGFTGSIRSLAGQMMGLAGAAVDASLGVGGLLARDPKQRRELARTGSFLRRVRESAGMTLADVGRAVDLKDTELLALAERGKAAHDFITIYRARDAARRLSDAEFARVLAFIEAAFDLALDLVAGGAKSRKAPAAKGRERAAAGPEADRGA
jgi:transcriptional regulator with XRE-family HTH domain